jgi:hypothetical protein
VDLRTEVRRIPLVALNYFTYNFIKIHRTLRMSPAMAAGVTDRLWSVEDLVTLWEAYEQRRDRKSGSVNSQRETWKIFLGTMLLILTPLRLFVKPATEGAILRDLLVVIWWAFVLWLLVSGLKGSQRTNSK